MKMTNFWAKAAKDIVQTSAIGSGSGNLSSLATKALSYDGQIWIRREDEDGNFIFDFVSNEAIDETETYSFLNGAPVKVFSSSRAFPVFGDDFLYYLSPQGRVKSLNYDTKRVEKTLPLGSTVRGRKQIPVLIKSKSSVNDMAMGEDGQFQPIGLRLYFHVFNVSEVEFNDMHIIQFFYADAPPFLVQDDNGEERLLSSLNDKIAFVDGGKGSQKNRPAPWYNAPRREQLFKYPAPDYNKEPDKRFINPTNYCAQILLSDTVGAALKKKEDGISFYFQQLNFESYFVDSNYRGEGKIAVKARVRWGFITDIDAPDGQQIRPLIEQPIVEPVRQFSNIAQQIWNKAYGTSAYRLHQ